MSRHNRPFKFKQFEVNHHRSSMKVGVDAVILGAWAYISDAKTILDVGCGCGVISLMCAQRNHNAEILAVDIHRPSIEEASDNFNASPWRDRIFPILSDFIEFTHSYKGKVDYIISNPPYFDSGIDNPETSREVARHQGGLSPEIIIRFGRRLLSKGGRIGMVIPFEQSEDIRTVARNYEMSPLREMIMVGREGKEPKRSFLEFANVPVKSCETQTLIIEKEDGKFTDQYRELCRDFYQKF